MVWNVSWNSGNTTALVALAIAQGIHVFPSPAELGKELNRTALSPPGNADITDRAIRDLLRMGGFKPAGRNRPAQEYLARMAESDGGLSSISNAVDVNNLISLRHHLPASVITASVAPGGVIIREGRPGESYPFNATGQELRLDGLLCLCSRDDVPVASPVKDAFASHVDDSTTDIIVCVYSSVAVTSVESLNTILDEYMDLLFQYCGGSLSNRLIARAE